MIQKIKSFFEEFSEFLRETDMIDVAIGLLAATAVKDLATQFIATFVTPIINKLLQVLGMQTNGNMTTTIFGIDFPFLAFISQLITFIGILFIAFIILNLYAKFKKNEKSITDQEEKDKGDLLIEIRDLLKQNLEKNE